MYSPAESGNELANSMTGSTANWMSERRFISAASASLKGMP